MCYVHLQFCTWPVNVNVQPFPTTLPLAHHTNLYYRSSQLLPIVITR